MLSYSPKWLLNTDQWTLFGFRGGTYYVRIIDIEVYVLCCLIKSILFASIWNTILEYLKTFPYYEVTLHRLSNKNSNVILSLKEQYCALELVEYSKYQAVEHGDIDEFHVVCVSGAEAWSSSGMHLCKVPLFSHNTSEVTWDFKNYQSLDWQKYEMTGVVSNSSQQINHNIYW